MKRPATERLFVCVLVASFAIGKTYAHTSSCRCRLGRIRRRTGLDKRLLDSTDRPRFGSRGPVAVPWADPTAARRPHHPERRRYQQLGALGP